MIGAYCWWTVCWWRDSTAAGVKVGPVGVAWYRWDGWHVYLSVLQRPVVDSGVWAHRA